jgi:hypothetical protein
MSEKRTTTLIGGDGALPAKLPTYLAANPDHPSD